MAWDGMGAFVRRARAARGARARPPARRPRPRGRGHRRPRDEGGGPGAALRGRRAARRFRSSSTPSARARACRSRSASTTSRSTRAPSPSSSRTRAPSSARELAQLALKLPELAHVPPAARRRAAPARRSCSTGDDVDLDALPDPHLLAGRRRPLHHAAPGHHARPRDAASATSAATGCRSSTAAAPRCTGRSTRPARATSGAPGSWGCAGSRSPSRSAATRRSPTRRPRRCPTGSTSGCSRGSCASAPSTTVQCKTVDLEVPADADFVLEGYVDPQRGPRRRGAVRRPHRLLHAGRPLPALPRHRAHAPRRTPSTPRRSSGRRPMEDAWLGKATERLFLPLLRMLFPEVVDMNLPVEGAFHNLVLVSIKKQYPFHAARLAHGLWGAGQMTFSKVICVVDDDVDVQDVGRSPGGCSRTSTRSATSRSSTGRSTSSITAPTRRSGGARCASTGRASGRKRGTRASGRSRAA